MGGFVFVEPLRMPSAIRRLLALLFVLLAGCASCGPAQREAQR
jgi:hypothetical protein